MTIPRHIQVPTIGTEQEPGVKVCKCGTRGGVHNSQSYPTYYRRRYTCPKCNARWTTYEVPSDNCDRE